VDVFFLKHGVFYKEIVSNKILTVNVDRNFTRTIHPVIAGIWKISDLSEKQFVLRQCFWRDIKSKIVKKFSIHCCNVVKLLYPKSLLTPSTH